MKSKLRLSRRRAVRLVGAVGLGAAGAGCLDDETSTGTGGSSGTGSDADAAETDSEGDDANDPDERDQRILPPGERILFEARSTGWIGVAPATIESEENPTLVLSEGATYEIGWTEGDGETHSVELQGADGAVVDDLATADASAPDDDQRLEFEAGDELAAYACGTHDAMRGAIEIAPVATDREQVETDPEVRYRIEPGESIALDGQTSGWVGVSPPKIQGEENPTLVLEKEAEYEIGWVGGDGVVHNVELRDEEGELVDDHSTEIVADPGDDQVVAFEASRELAHYVCRPHESTMRGRIHVE